MGKDKDKPQAGYGPINNQGGNDPRGQNQNMVQYQQQRYESQQGPLADTMGYNYGRGSEADYGNYTDIMNQYRDIASGGGSGGSSGSGGGGGPASSYSAHLVNPQMAATERAGTERAAAARQLGPLERVSAQQLNPMQRVQAQQMGPLQQVNARQLGNNIERVKASDPFQSYGGYQEFSKTGGYSGQDIADMRARGVAPIRAAYANAERNMGQQRSLQGGYSPNSIAAQVKMAREQGQGMADASQNVDAGIAQARNAGRLAGLGGMAGIEGNRLNAQMQGDIFNAGQYNQGQQFDIANELNAGQFNANQAFQGRLADVNNDFAGQQFNSNQAFQGNQFDIGNKLQSDIYNSGQAFQGQQFDISNEMNTNQFNAGQGNQVGMFNAGQANNMNQFNSNLDFQGQTFNSGAMTQADQMNGAAAEAAASRSAQASAASNRDRLAALEGMSNLYGTTPGMSNTFGNQAMGIVGQGANFGIGMTNAMNAGNQLPGAWDQTMGRANDVMDLYNSGAGIANAFLDGGGQQQQTQTQNPYVNYGGTGGGYSNGDISFQQPSFGTNPFTTPQTQPRQSTTQQRNYFGTYNMGGK